MRIIWLGQGGLLFEAGQKTVIIDPYLSDSVRQVQPQNARRVPVDEHFLKIKPDVIVITHEHLDHLDVETLMHYFSSDHEMTVLAPNGSWQKLREFFSGNHNYVLFNSGTQWTEGELHFTAVKAEHSDPFAIGLILSAEEEHYYITGDTLYNEHVFESLPMIPLKAVFLPVNGRGNNMNMRDAERFVERVGAEYAVPFHFGMFDDLSAENFCYTNVVIPKIFQEIDFN